MRLEEFNYSLPEELITQYPSEKRDESRLLVVNKRDKKIHHRVFNEILHFMEEGDALVINNTKVIPARLIGKKETGGRVEVLIIRQFGASRLGDKEKGSVWECLIKSSKKPKKGSKIFFNEYLEGEVTEKGPDGKCVISFYSDGDFEDILDKIGRMPLPPYIKRNGNSKDRQIDAERYQTVFARNKGAIAAPTAGFHFTEELISRIREKGVKVAPITVHIGLGTFTPIRVENIEEHVLEAEYFDIKPESANLINNAITDGKKIIAVGTSATRALESAVGEDRSVKPMSGQTNLFIYHGYQFKIVDVLITNFHLPMSTPLLLVSAFAGKTLTEDSYQKAIKATYRFLSYGDGMMIL